MIGTLDERQPSDDLRRLGRAEIGPPGTARVLDAHETEVAGPVGHRLDDGARALVRGERHREAEMEPGAVAQARVAAGDVGVDGIGRLHVGEGRDDDPPDPLDGVERQDPFVPRDDAAHHLGLARRPERRAAALACLDGDQAIDDLAALDQARVEIAVDPVDLVAQRLEAGGRRLRFGQSHVHAGAFIVAARAQGKDDATARLAQPPALRRPSP